MKRLFAALPLATACLAAPVAAQDRNPDFAARAAALYAEQPDFENCRPGRLKPEITTTLTARVNEVRALHGLAPVTYNPATIRIDGEGKLIFKMDDISEYLGRDMTAEIFEVNTSTHYGRMVRIDDNTVILFGNMDEVFEYI